MNVGDKVVWFSNSRTGKVTSFRKGHGVITNITGDMATIKTTTKSRVKKRLEQLTLKSKDTPLSIFNI